MNIINGEIVLTLGQAVSWMSFTSAGARELAENLVKMAAETEKSDGVKPTGRSIQ
jgi:hypothetical protein